jgi:hypothetical protein
MLLTSSNNCVPGSLKWADPRCHPRVGYNSSLPDEKTGHCSSEAKSTFRRLPISSHVLSPSKQSVKSETLDMSDLFPGPDSGHVGCCRTFLGARRHRAVLRQTRHANDERCIFRHGTQQVRSKEAVRQQPPQPPGNWPPNRGSLACSGLK